jgi:colicin import membrane protein
MASWKGAGKVAGKVAMGIGGVGLLAGGFVGRQLGLGPAGLAAAAVGGAFTGGYKLFSGKGAKSGGSPKNIAKTSMLGGSPEVITRIAQEVNAIKGILMSQDPASEEREKALDAEVRHRELIDALKSRGLTGPKKEKEGSFWDRLKPLLGSLLGIAGLSMLPQLFAALPNVLEKVQDVLDKIGSFLSELQNWFAILGAGIPAAMMMTPRGMGRSVNRVSSGMRAGGTKTQSLHTSRRFKEQQRLRLLNKERLQKLKDAKATQQRVAKRQKALQRIRAADAAAKKLAAQQLAEHKAREKEKLKKFQAQERIRAADAKAAQRTAAKIRAANLAAEKLRLQQLRNSARQYVAGGKGSAQFLKAQAEVKAQEQRLKDQKAANNRAKATETAKRVEAKRIAAEKHRASVAEGTRRYQSVGNQRAAAVAESNARYKASVAAGTKGYRSVGSQTGAAQAESNARYKASVAAGTKGYRSVGSQAGAAESEHRARYKASVAAGTKGYQSVGNQAGAAEAEHRARYKASVAAGTKGYRSVGSQAGAADAETQQRAETKRVAAAEKLHRAEQKRLADAEAKRLRAAQKASAFNRIKTAMQGRYAGMASAYQGWRANKASSAYTEEYRKNLSENRKSQTRITPRVMRFFSGEQLMAQEAIDKATPKTGRNILQGEADPQRVVKTGLGYNDLTKGQETTLRKKGFNLTKGVDNITRVKYPAMPPVALAENKLTEAQRLLRAGQGNPGKSVKAADVVFHGDRGSTQLNRQISAGKQAAGGRSHKGLSVSENMISQTQAQMKQGANRYVRPQGYSGKDYMPRSKGWHKASGIAANLQSSKLKIGAAVLGPLLLVTHALNEMGRYYAETYVPEIDGAYKRLFLKLGKEPTSEQLYADPKIGPARMRMQAHFHKTCVLIAGGLVVGLFMAKLGAVAGGIFGAKVGGILGAGAGGMGAAPGAGIGLIIGGFVGGLVGGILGYSIGSLGTAYAVSMGEEVYGQIIPQGTPYWPPGAIDSIGKWFYRGLIKKEAELMKNALRARLKKEAEVGAGVTREDFKKMVNNVDSTLWNSLSSGPGTMGLPWAVEFNNATQADMEHRDRIGAATYTKNRERIMNAFRSAYPLGGITNKYAGAIDAGKWRSNLFPGRNAGSTAVGGSGYQQTDSGVQDSKYPNAPHVPLSSGGKYSGQPINQVFSDMYNAQKSDFAGSQGRNIGKWGPDAGRWPALNSGGSSGATIILINNVDNSSQTKAVSTTTASSTTNIHTEKNDSIWGKITNWWNN